MFLNEFDPFAAEWLRNLFPAATVDTRSITDVAATDVRHFQRVHWFAGIGGWQYALELAGWPDEWPVWTGSCPCQPFSAAGQNKGEDDERDLWPELFRLISECRPNVVFGEQVPNAITKHGWLDRISADLEAAGYTVGAVVLGAHSVGAPHIRQRLFWVAVSDTFRHDRRQATGRRHAEDAEQAEADCRRGRLADTNGGDTGSGQLRLQPERGGGDGAATVEERADGGLEHSASDGRDARRAESERGSVAARCEFGGLGDTSDTGPQRRSVCGSERGSEQSPWAASVLIPCRDGKTRRISSQPGDEPLAYGVPRDLGRTRTILEGMGYGPKEVKRMLRRPRSLLALAGRNRVGRLRGYGNAITVPVAAVFIQSVMEWMRCADKMPED
jgi:DNA (cytosine-5)-methyltransferase 1